MHRLKHHGSHYQTLLCNHRNQAVKKKSPLNKCTYITHSPFLSLSFLSFPPSSQVQQQLRASPCTAPALRCILPCRPSSSSVPVPAASICSAPVPTTTTFVCSQPHASIHTRFSFPSLCILGLEINLLYTCHFLQNFDLLCLQPLTSFPSLRLPPACTHNT